MAYMFRIVGPMGQGLYTGCVGGDQYNIIERPWECCCNDALDHDRHPVPRQDSRLARGMQDQDMDPWGGWDNAWVFGFASIEQMRSWIYRGTWRTNLGEFGCKLLVLEAPEDDYIPGDTQAMMRGGKQVASVPLDAVWAYYDTGLFLAENLEVNPDEWEPE